MFIGMIYTSLQLIVLRKHVVKKKFEQVCEAQPTLSKFVLQIFKDFSVPSSLIYNDNFEEVIDDRQVE